LKKRGGREVRGAKRTKRRGVGGNGKKERWVR